MNNQINSTNNTIKYETTPGQSITSACIEATLLAIKHQCDVEIEFNGIKLIATKAKPSQHLEHEFKTILKENREKYLQSDVYKESKLKQEKELLQHQENIDSVMISFTPTVEHGDLDSLMNWVKEFATHGDYIGLLYDKMYIVDFLELNGFKENEHVGQPKEFFNNKENTVHYIVGQVISCLRKGMPPHQITLKFIEDYFKL